MLVPIGQTPWTSSRCRPRVGKHSVVHRIVPPEATYTTVTEESGDEINPFLSDKEKGNLLSSGEESNGDNDREMDKPPAKREVCSYLGDKEVLRISVAEE